MADNSQHVRKSINFKPNASPNLSSTGDLGVDSADSNRLKYNPGTGAERVALQQDVTAEASTRASADATLTTAVGTAQTDITTHKANTANPHAVTKTQVGLGNVDNTADANKPVSTAQQTALNLKVDITSGTSTNQVLTTPRADTLSGKTSASLTLTADSGQNVNLTSVGTGKIVVNGIEYNLSNQIISSNASALEIRAATGQDTKINAFTGNVLLQANNLTQAKVVSTGIELASGKTLSVSGGGSIVPPTSGTVTVPAATDTLVGKATTDTLTNKTIAAGSNTITGLTNSNLSGSAGISIANGGTGASTKAAAFDALSPMTTSGDIIYGGTSGTGTRLAKGADGTFLTLASGVPAWASATFTTTNPTVQRFTSGTGTYTTPAGVKYIRVKIAGGGGGGQGGWAGGWGTAGSAGGASTFGSSLLTANGGSGGNINGGSGGTVTVNSPAISIVTMTGGAGGGGSFKVANTNYPSGYGGFSSLFAGAGGTTIVGATAGNTAQANSGCGGSGGGLADATAGALGAGGGAGGYLEVIIASPSATYAYAVGAAGAGANSGNISFAGGSGAAGVIIVEEHYQ